MRRDDLRAQAHGDLLKVGDDLDEPADRDRVDRVVIRPDSDVVVTRQPDPRA